MSVENGLLIQRAITSLVFVTGVRLIRVALVRLVGMGTPNMSVDNRRRWRVNIRNAIIRELLKEFSFASKPPAGHGPPSHLPPDGSSARLA